MLAIISYSWMEAYTNRVLQLQLRELAAISRLGNEKKNQHGGGLALYTTRLRFGHPLWMPFPPSLLWTFIQTFWLNFPLLVNNRQCIFSLALRCPNHQMNNWHIFKVVTTLSWSTLIFNSFIISVIHECTTTFPIAISFLLLSWLYLFFTSLLILNPYM